MNFIKYSNSQVIFIYYITLLEILTIRKIFIESNIYKLYKFLCVNIYRKFNKDGN